MAGEQIGILTPGKRAIEPVKEPRGADRTTDPALAALPQAGERPVLPPGVPEFFAPASPGMPFEPLLYGAASVRFIDRKLKVDASRVVVRTVRITEAAVPVDWDTSSPTELSPEALYDAASRSEVSAAANCCLEPEALPHLGITVFGLDRGQRDARAVQEPGDWRGITLRRIGTRLPGTAAADGREARDRTVEALRRNHAPKQAALDERLRRAQQGLSRESEQATGQVLQTAISMGATLVGTLFGRKIVSAGNLGRATTAARGVGRSIKESQDTERARQTVAAVEAERRRLEDELAGETAAIGRGPDAANDQLERVTVRPKKTDLNIKIVALLWTPR